MWRLCEKLFEIDFANDKNCQIAGVFDFQNCDNKRWYNNQNAELV